MKSALLLALVVLGAGTLSATTPASAETWPLCGDVQQPTMPDPQVTEAGVTFTWEGGSPPVLDKYAFDVGRRANGATVAEGWREVNEAVHEWFVPWVKDGVHADALVLSVLNICAGEQNGPERWVWFSDFEKQQAKAEAAAQAEADAASQAAVDAAVADELAKQRPTPVRCISKSTFKKKKFWGQWAKRQKCPKGWVKI